MGKLFRKMLALTLVVAMLMSGAVTAFAADDVAAAANDDKSLLMTWEEIDAYDMPQAPSQKPAVMLNGDYVAFDDAVPVNVNGRVMVPFRAILEALGATVSYDKDTKEISAVLGDRSISFYAGKADIKIEENGEVSKITMDVVPFIDAYTQRTYVSTRFAAEAFGLSVGWDNSEKTVIIIDFKSMIPEIAAKFKTVGMILDSQDFDWTQNYKTTGDLNLAVSLDKAFVREMTGLTANGINAALKMNIEGIQKGMNIDAKVGIDTDIDEIYDLIGISGPEKAYVEEMLKGLDIAVKMDDENIYISMGLLDYIMQGETGEAPAKGQTTWYVIPLSLVYDVYNELGIDFETLMKSVTAVKTLEDYLEMFMNMSGSNLNIYTYKKVCIAVAIFDEFIGDDEFTKSGNTYTLSITPESVARKFAKLGSETAEEYLEKMTTAGINFDLGLKIKTTSAGKMLGYDLKGAMDLTDLIGMDNAKMTLTAKGNLYEADVEAAIDIPNIAKVALTLSEDVTKTNKAPDLRIPTGDKLVDLSNFM